MLFVQCTWDSNLYYTAAPSTRVKNSQLDATTEQNADLDPKWLELRTTLHIVYARTKQTLASTIVAKVLAWICQWAAELLKKGRSLPTLKIIETLWSQASVVSAPPSLPQLDSRHYFENSTDTPVSADAHLHHTTSATHTHTHIHNWPLLILVRTAHTHS